MLISRRHRAMLRLARGFRYPVIPDGPQGGPIRNLEVTLRLGPLDSGVARFTRAPE
jgi:hypothetical protein